MALDALEDRDAHPSNREELQKVRDYMTVGVLAAHGDAFQPPMAAGRGGIFWACSRRLTARSTRLWGTSDSLATR